MSLKHPKDGSSEVPWLMVSAGILLIALAFAHGAGQL